MAHTYMIKVFFYSALFLSVSNFRLEAEEVIRMRYILRICGIFLLFFFFQSFSVIVLASTDRTSNFSSIDVRLTNLPWWIYGIILVVLIGLVFVLLRRKNQDLQNRIPIRREEPITKRRENPTIIPGNAQTIGSRDEQQDAFGFSDIYDDAFMQEFGVLAVLADGMGGLHGGREASHVAVQGFLDHYSQSSAIPSIPQKLISSLDAANQSVLQFAREQRLLGNVGTTLVAAVIFQHELYWISVGDSRIYLMQGESLTQLTSEHKYATELEKRAALGEISEEVAKNDPQRESLTSFLGLEKLEQVDISEKSISLQKGDSIILCSDGVYGSLSNDEILEVCRYLPTQEAAEELITLVLSKKIVNQDNATVAILTID